MLLKQLEYFITVVETGSFTKAAEELYITQSAISQQIKALENELGVSLTKKEGRSFALTPAGEYFYRHGKSIYQRVENFKAETIRRGQEDELSLKIGYLRGQGSSQLQQTLQKFASIYPEVSISVYNGTHEELFHMLLDGRLDLKISDQRRAFNKDYNNYELIHSDCYIELPENHPLAKRETLTLSDLNHMTCIIVSSKEQEEVEKDFYHHTLGYHNQFMCSETLDQARLLVLSNRGFLPVDEVGTLPPIEGIKRVPLYHKGNPVQRVYCAFWAKEKTNYYIEEFAAMLKEMLNDKRGINE